MHMKGCVVWIRDMDQQKVGGFEGVGGVQDGKVSWTERKTNEEVLYQVEEDR